MEATWMPGSRRSDIPALHASNLPLAEWFDTGEGNGKDEANKEDGLIHHSDRGREYACQDFRDVLTVCGISASMSRRGNSRDTTLSEALSGSLKVERLHGQRHTTMTKPWPKSSPGYSGTNGLGRIKRCRVSARCGSKNAGMPISLGMTAHEPTMGYGFRGAGRNAYANCKRRQRFRIQTTVFSKGIPMTSVRACLAQKPQPVVTISVRSDEKVVAALQLMRDNRVRAILVINDDRLVGILTQGDCAIKVLLPGLDAKQVLVKEVMTVDPVTVKLQDPIEACTGLMASRNFRHLPVVEAGRVVGVISIGDVVKDSIRQMGQQIGFLETYIKGHSGNLS